jgi:hypothetical protein
MDVKSPIISISLVKMVSKTYKASMFAILVEFRPNKHIRMLTNVSTMTLTI